jgi:hypothetical protein
MPLRENAMLCQPGNPPNERKRKDMARFPERKKINAARDIIRNPNQNPNAKA